MPKRKKDEEIDGRLELLEAAQKSTTLLVNEKFQTVLERLDKLEVELATTRRELWEIQQGKPYEPPSEPTERPKKQRRTSKSTAKPTGSRVKRVNKSLTKTSEDHIKLAKSVIVDWRNAIYGSQHANGGQHFIIRSATPLTSNAHFRDYLENESAWLASREGQLEDSTDWTLQLFCKGRHDDDNKWKAPFVEMFVQNAESEKEE